jgi:S-adenosylmethionine uptake transporter
VPLCSGIWRRLGAAVIGGDGSVIVRKIGRDERSVVLMLYPMVLTGLGMGLAMPFVYKPMPVEHLGLTAVMACAGDVRALAEHRWPIASAPAVIVAPMQYSQMLWAAFYGWLFFNEDIDFWTAVGVGGDHRLGIYIVLREGTPRCREPPGAGKPLAAGSGHRCPRRAFVAG